MSSFKKHETLQPAKDSLRDYISEAETTDNVDGIDNGLRKFLLSDMIEGDIYDYFL